MIARCKSRVSILQMHLNWFILLFVDGMTDNWRLSQLSCWDFWKIPTKKNLEVNITTVVQPANSLFRQGIIRYAKGKHAPVIKISACWVYLDHAIRIMYYQEKEITDLPTSVDSCCRTYYSQCSPKKQYNSVKQIMYSFGSELFCAGP